MRKEKKSKHFLNKPVFPGGLAAIKKVISENLKYPEEAQINQIEGSVYLRYEIDYKGQVKEAKIISSLGYGCDEEAIRLVKLLRFEVPKTRGFKVAYHKNIRIHFNLPKTEAPSKTIINYSYSTNSTDKKNNKKKPNSGNYNYTIRL